MTDAARTLQAVGDVLRSADLLEEVRGPEDISVEGVAQDSRRVVAGDLFTAWSGTEVDAHDFVVEAVNRGAVAAVVERPVDVSIPQLVVSDGRRAAALAASAVMGFPTLRLVTIGVTGTNGKTTTALVIRHLLQPELKTAVVGTLGVLGDEGVRPGTEGLTTPGPVQVAIWLRELLDEGVDAVVLEASSHALEQHRLDGVSFRVAVFTNLSQDHLDYHGDMEAYRSAKARLVELVAQNGTVVVNVGDPSWEGLDVAGRSLRTFGVDVAADVTASRLQLDAAGTWFDLGMDGAVRRVRIPLVGRYNVANALAAISAARAVGVPAERIVERLSNMPPVRGRLEPVVSQPYSVIIDFAHTPAALEGALAAVRPFTAGRLIVVFGAGGDRDRTKRGPMSEAVSSVADLVVLTSDNPRTEDPETILDDLEAGLHGVPHMRFVDRRDAIRAALDEAREGDTVVLAGKGHETYQVIGLDKRPFDERAIVLELLGERNDA
jgi:UDP-N-acetylmuramoyl-L-alanyl-D-glutamate--2,6-diaminopimelate ligase